MNAEDFFTSLYESSWRSNMKHEALKRIDKILMYLEENRDAVADAMIESVKDMEMLKLEQKEEFTYTSFKKWIDHYSKELINSKIEEMDKK